MTPSMKRLAIAGSVLGALVVGILVALLVGKYITGSSSAPATASDTTLPAVSANSPPGATPAPKILVIDRAAILRESAAGKDMVAQIDALTKSAEAEFKSEDDKLRADIAAFQQQSAVLAADARAAKGRELEARQQAFQKKVQERQNEIQAGVYKARKQVEDALGPILEAIMTERGANLLVDRQAIVLGTVDVDVTPLAIQRLDQKVSKVKVELTNPGSLIPPAQGQPGAAPPLPSAPAPQ